MRGPDNSQTSGESLSLGLLMVGGLNRHQTTMEHPRLWGGGQRGQRARTASMRRGRSSYAGFIRNSAAYSFGILIGRGIFSSCALGSCTGALSGCSGSFFARRCKAPSADVVPV